VLSTAGPFARYGSLLVQACVEEGSHYTDITGENHWVKGLIDKHHDEAASKGIRIIPSCGYDSIPSDIGAFFTISQFNKPVSRVDVYHEAQGGASGGTTETIFTMDGVGKEMRDPFVLNPKDTISDEQRENSKDGFIDKIVEKMIDDDEHIDFCLVGEPTSSKKVADCARVGRRGSLGGKLKIFGKQGHIAYPENVINPIFLSSDLITKLKNKKWDNGNDIFDPTSFQISNISSGTGAHNVVPGNLEIIFNFRFSTESSEQSLKADFESIINDLGINYECEWDLNGDPYLTEENFFKDIVCSSVEEITGYLPELNAKGGTSDGRFVAKMNTEIVELGPVNQSIHQVDEHVKISDLWKLKDIYKNILVNLNQNL
jgi:succinyl-diaminopimelate desuccinylase